MGEEKTKLKLYATIKSSAFKLCKIKKNGIIQLQIIFGG